MLLSIIWGGSFFFIEVALSEMTPFTIVLFRVGAGAIILVAYVYLSGRQMPRDLSIWAAFFILGLLNNLIPFSLIVWGQMHIDSSMASILNATTPIFSVVLTHFFTSDERLTSNRVLGIIFGWIGVVVLIGWETISGFGLHIIGQLAVLGAALSYAFAAIYGRRFKDISPVVVSAGMLCGTTLMMIPLTLIFEQPWNLHPAISTWGALAGLAILSTAIAYIIYFKVLATAGATNILLVTFLIPISAIFLGVLLLGERPGLNVFIGMILIFAGLIVIDGRLVMEVARIRNKFVRLAKNNVSNSAT